MPADVLILGARGMFGHMAARVLGSRFKVLAPDRPHPGGDRGFDVFQSDEEHAALLGDLKPGGLIVNAVAVLQADIPSDAAPDLRERVLAVNGLFPHRLARLAERLSQRVVQISTDAVFASEAGVVDEGAATAPQDLYGESKARGELMEPHTLTIRCSLIGPPPPHRNRGLWAWVSGASEGGTIQGYTNQVWSGLTTQQLAEACAGLVDPDAFQKVRAHGGVHHLAPNPVVSKFELVRALADVLRPDLTVVPALATLAIRRILASRHCALASITPCYPDWTAAITAAARS